MSKTITVKEVRRVVPSDKLPLGYTWVAINTLGYRFVGNTKEEAQQLAHEYLHPPKTRRAAPAPPPVKPRRRVE